MQGTAADLIKLAMVEVQRTIEQQQRRSRIVMQVHDELVLEVPDDELEWVRKELPLHMTQVAQLDVLLLAEVGTGPNWDQANRALNLTKASAITDHVLGASLPSPKQFL
jgi:DNA polymerase I